METNMATTLVTTIKSLFALVFGDGGALDSFFGWVTSADVLPFFVIGIAMSVILMAVKLVRSAVWGA